jgi:ABC-type sulfate transport system substrate-binding protein
MSNQVTIIPIQKIGEDRRGSTHVFDTDRTGEFIIAYRNKGSLSGRHYHKGRSANKNPEKIIIMQGQATVNWIDVKTGEKGVAKAIAPAMVQIQAWVWHEVVADEDMVVFELNALADGQGDTFQLEHS